MRTELGLAAHPYSELDSGFLPILNDCLELPMRLPAANGDSAKAGALPEFELQSAGKHFAKLYLQASTTAAGLKTPGLVQDWWVSACEPMLLVESGPWAKAPAATAQVVGGLAQFGLRLFHFWVYRKGARLRAWVVVSDRGANRDAARRLRLNLLRLHAEQECLKQVLRWLAQERILVMPGTPPSDALQSYLNDGVAKLQRLERDGLPNRDIFDAALDYENIVGEGDRASFLAQLAKMRLNVRRNVEKFTQAARATGVTIMGDHTGPLTINEGKVEGNQWNEYMNEKNEKKVVVGAGATVYGGVVVADQIQNSFNKAAESSVNPELKEKLKELSSLVKQAVTELPSDQAEEASETLKTLVDEATKAKPRREWYELSAKGLIEAAKTAATLATPIATAVKTILGLLG